MHRELRQLIRELLEQEIQALGMQSSLQSVRAQVSATPESPQYRVQEEFVTMTSDIDLANFVTRMLKLSADPASLSALRTGQLVFKLTAVGSNAATATHAVPANQAIQHNKFTHDVVSFERGLFTERECTKLDPAVRLLRVGKTVRITPLAADSLRHRGISTQRAES